MGPAPFAPPSVPPSYAGYPGYYASPMEYERTRQVDRTKTGVLLLLIGTLLTWVPFGIAIIGYVLIFIGVILVILGRRAFGSTHARNVVISIVVFIVGCIIFVGVAVIAAIAGAVGSIGPGGTVNLTPAFLASVYIASLLGLIVFAAVVGIAEVLFTYALQDSRGRIFLWAAYGANLALAIAVYALTAPMASGVVTGADYDALVASGSALQLLTVAPAGLFAVADYLAWSRITKGEVPAPVAGAAAPPPYPGTPPQAPPSGPAPPLNPR